MKYLLHLPNEFYENGTLSYKDLRYDRQIYIPKYVCEGGYRVTGHLRIPDRKSYSLGNQLSKNSSRIFFNLYVASWSGL